MGETSYSPSKLATREGKEKQLRTLYLRIEKIDHANSLGIQNFDLAASTNASGLAHLATNDDIGGFSLGGPGLCPFPHIIWLKKMSLNHSDIAQILEVESISTNIRFRFSYDKELTVLAKIVQIDHGSGWCYVSCSKCNKKLDAIDGSIRYPIQLKHKI
ncbi:hypothetical protein LXL04_025338 [Taraxacum kok-saghyz]